MTGLKCSNCGDGWEEGHVCNRMPWQQVEGACRGCDRDDCALVKQHKSEAAYQACLAHTVERLERAQERTRIADQQLDQQMKQCEEHQNAVHNGWTAARTRAEAAEAKLASALRLLSEAVYECPEHHMRGFDPDCAACVAKNEGSPFLAIVEPVLRELRKAE